MIYISLFILLVSILKHNLSKYIKHMQFDNHAMVKLFEVKFS